MLSFNGEAMKEFDPTDEDYNLWLFLAQVRAAGSDKRLGQWIEEAIDKKIEKEKEKVK